MKLSTSAFNNRIVCSQHPWHDKGPKMAACSSRTGYKEVPFMGRLTPPSKQCTSDGGNHLFQNPAQVDLPITCLLRMQVKFPDAFVSKVA